MPDVAAAERGTPPPARPESAPEGVRGAPHPHVKGDHMGWTEPDGTVTRVCVCVCDRCWTPGVAEPGPCPDWNNDTEDV